MGGHIKDIDQIAVLLSSQLSNIITKVTRVTNEPPSLCFKYVIWIPNYQTKKMH